jgi:hypothetical protein
MKHITVFAFTAVAMMAAGQAIAADKPALPAAVSSEDLASMSGGAKTAVALTNQSLTAVNGGNTVSAETLTTGNATLQSNAFSGFSGIGNFVINTGNNNNLQGSLSVTIIAPN